MWTDHPDDGIREAYGRVWYYDHWEAEDYEMDCQGVKKDGDPCQFKAREGCKTCWRHRTQEEVAKRVSKKQPAKEGDSESE